MKIRHLIEALPLLAIALVAAAIVPRFFPPSADPLESDSDRPKVVSVPQKRELPQSEEWQVVRVSDGDTISVKKGFESARVRFACIDSPEKSQPFGEESKANLQRLINQAGGRVLLSVVDTDRYGRRVAEVFTVLGNGEEKLLQEEQLKSGLAYVYERYLSNCLSTDAVRSAEAIARANHAGVWSGNYVKPWEWRKRQRQNRGN